MDNLKVNTRNNTWSKMLFKVSTYSRTKISKVIIAKKQKIYRFKKNNDRKGER
jgi:hypothetical protein